MKTALLVFFFLGAWADGIPQFKKLKSNSSYAFDGHFAFPAFKGRVRLSSLGEAHLLVEGATKHECQAEIDHLTQNTVKMAPTVSLYFRRPFQCRPALTAAMEKLMVQKMELEFSRDRGRIWLQSREAGARLARIKYQRNEMIGLIKNFAKKTGTGKGAEKAL